MSYETRPLLIRPNQPIISAWIGAAVVAIAQLGLFWLALA
jgi:hypothetical protein